MFCYVPVQKDMIKTIWSRIKKDEEEPAEAAPEESAEAVVEAAVETVAKAVAEASAEKTEDSDSGNAQ